MFYKSYTKLIVIIAFSLCFITLFVIQYIIEPAQQKNKIYTIYCERVDGKAVKYTSLGYPDIEYSTITFFDKNAGMDIVLINTPCQLYKTTKLER